MPLNNFANVDWSVWRGAQPDDNGYATLRQLDIYSICSLNHGTTDQNWKGPLFSIDMNTFNPLREQVENAIAFIVRQPRAYVHCTHGRDRTGLVIGAYRLKVSRWPLENVLEERALFGTNAIIDIGDHEILEVLQQIAAEMAP